MFSSDWRIMKHLARLYDIFAMLAAFVIATILLYASSSGTNFAQFMTMRITVLNGIVFAMLLLTWHNLFILCGLYDSKRLTPCFSEIQDVCKATLLGALVFLATGRLLHIHMMTAAFAVTMWVICAAVMVSGRLVARWLLALLRRRGKNARYLLIFGTNARAVDFADRIRNRPELGYSIVGFIDDPWDGTQAFLARGYSLCCTFSGLAEFLRHNVIDESAIFLPLASHYELSSRLVSICEQHGIAIRTESQVFKLRIPESLDRHIDEGSQVLSIPESI
jgi:FlaA1/EpsC-like NDP-sugar epimerase